MPMWTTVDPFENKPLRNWHFASSEQIDHNLQELHKGFHDWKRLSCQDRQKELLLVVDEFKRQAEAFTQSISLQMGKPLLQSQGEVKKTIEAAEYLCKMDLSFLAEEKISSIYNQSVVHLDPLGVIVSIMPWNFPLWQVMRMVFPTLLVGNTVLLKHSEITPEVGELVEKCFAVTKIKTLKHCLFQHDQTDAILQDARVCGVSLTGSAQAGSVIAETAGRHLKKSILELGGSDPYLVMFDADLRLATKKIVGSRVSNCGQVCISAKRALVHKSLIAEFTERAESDLKKLVFGSPLSAATTLGPLAHHKFQKKYLEQTALLKKKADKVIEVAIDADNSAGVNPMVLVFSEQPSELKTMEVFGPCLAVIPFSNEKEAIDLANSTIYGLGAGIFSKDILQAKKIACEIIAGQIAINDTVKSDVHLPFGGMKSSGYGKEMGKLGFYEFTQTKVISV